MNIYSKVYLFVYFILLLLFLIFILRKGELHYKLLKEILPEKLTNTNFYTFIFSLNFFSLNFKNLIWLFVPFYFTRKKIYSSFSENNINNHRKLLKNNKIVLLILSVIILWLFVIGYFL